METDLPPDVSAVKTDPAQIQMVLSVLMTNSNEAIEDPGRIRVSTRNMDVDQWSAKDHPALRPGSYVCLSIEDNGHGIKLPDMSSNEVYPLVMKAKPNLKVVVCSSYALDGPAQEIPDAGAQAFIQKLFLISSLAEEVEGGIGRRIDQKVPLIFLSTEVKLTDITPAF